MRRRLLLLLTRGRQSVRGYLTPDGEMSVHGDQIESNNIIQLAEFASRQ